MKKLYIILLGAFFVLITSVQRVDAAQIEFSLGSGDALQIPIFSPGFDLDPFFDDEESEDVIDISSDALVIKKKEEERAVTAPKAQKKKKEGNSGKPQVKRTENGVLVTAYSSTVDQTDASPCITANGFNVCENNQENVIAANFLPFGTRVRLPDIYGEKIFTVRDRMHRRHSYRVDVWMKTRTKAKQFGVKHSKIEIVSEQIAFRP